MNLENLLRDLVKKTGDNNINVPELLKNIYKQIQHEEKISEVLTEIPEYLESKCKLVEFKANSTIVKKDEPTRYAYFVLSGDMFVLSEFDDGNYYYFASLKEGAVISDLEVLSQHLINAVTLVATKDTYMLRVRVEDFKYCLENDVKFLHMISTGLAKKMFISSYQRGKNLYKLGIDKVVLYIVNYCHKKNIDNGTVMINRTRQMIASEIGINLKTVNRSVATLRDKKCISIEKGVIHISNEQYQFLLKWIGKVNLYNQAYQDK